MIKYHKCPKCGKEMTNEFQAPKIRDPKPDDITICIECMAILFFNKEILLEELPDSVFDSLPVNEQYYVLNVRQTVRELKQASAKKTI